LIHTNTSSNELGSIGGCFDCCLLLGVPVNWGLVGKVQDASHRSPGDHIMVQVCIHIMGEGDKLSQGSRHVMREDFLDVAINSIGPVKLLIGQKVTLESAKTKERNST